MQTIPRRLSHCVSKGEIFSEGAVYISCLDATGNRADYCPNCWDQIRKPIEGHFWKGKIPVKKEKVLSADQKALQLFRQMQDPKLSFVLALYLQRKQQLVRRTQTLYEIPETGEVFQVEKVVLQPDEGEQLSQVLDQLIDGVST